MPILRADPPPNSQKTSMLRARYPCEKRLAYTLWYFTELYRLAAMAIWHTEVQRAILAAYGSLTPQEHAMDAANPSLLLRAALRKWGGLWVRRFDKLSLDLAAAFARKSFNVTQTQMRAALKEAGFTVKFEPTPGSRAAYQAVIAEQVNLIKSNPR